MFISSEKISFKYVEEKTILNDISFALNKSRTLSIVGASGCGKSTLLRIISGILPQTKNHYLGGKLIIDGQTPDQYRKSGKLAFMFQEPTLMPNLTVEENIAFPLKIKGIKDNERVTNLLYTVGLEDHSNKMPKELSGGMKTRVALARSFVTEPELLLLDEPFSALDIAWKSKLYIELEKLREQYHTTIVFVTHDVQEALILSNKIIVLGKNGTKLYEDIIESDFSILERVNDISDYIKTPTYQNYFIPIQKWIMVDGTRAVTAREEVDRILSKISSVVENGNNVWSTYQSDIDSIKEYTNVDSVNHLLVSAFRSSKSLDFKEYLMYHILNYKNLDAEISREIFNFYYTNIETASADACKWYQTTPEHLFRTVIKTRINGDRTKFPKEKLWIYLCDLYHSNETTKVLNYLNDVVEGKIEQLDYPFAKEVAQKVKEKIENEKVDAVFIA